MCWLVVEWSRVGCWGGCVVRGGKLSVTGEDEACRRKREGAWTPWHRGEKCRKRLGNVLAGRLWVSGRGQSQNCGLN